jgi:hypothetical protein
MLWVIDVVVDWILFAEKVVQLLPPAPSPASRTTSAVAASAAASTVVTAAT